MAFVSSPVSGNTRVAQVYMELLHAILKMEQCGVWLKNVDICLMPKEETLLRTSTKIIWGTEVNISHPGID